jgi:hypothetical protein
MFVFLDSGGRGTIPVAGGADLVAGDVDPVARSRYSSPYGGLGRRGYGSSATCAAVLVRLVYWTCLPTPARLLAAGAEL